MARNLLKAPRVAELCVFLLRFEHTAAVERAFAVVSDARKIPSCTVEPGELRIRFLATEKLGRRFSNECMKAVVWCKKYAMNKGPEAE